MGNTNKDLHAYLAHPRVKTAPVQKIAQVASKVLDLIQQLAHVIKVTSETIRNAHYAHPLVKTAPAQQHAQVIFHFSHILNPSNMKVKH